MKYSNIFWGVILITFGVLFAMRNLDIFFFSWRSVFRLWPLIFIFWGIAVLPVKSGLKILLTVVTVVLGIILLANSPRYTGGWFFRGPDFHYHDRSEEDSDERPWDKQEFSEDFDTGTRYATLNLDAAAGDFRLEESTPGLFEFRSEGNTGPYSVVTRDLNEESVIIDFHHKEFRGRPDLENKVWMKLNDKPLWKINIDVGAARFNMDLSPFRVERVDIDGGASAIELTIGDLHEMTRVSIEAGASDITIRVPEESACEVRTQTILSGKEFDGFNRIDKGLYQTPNFSSSARQVMIEIDAAVSGVTVERY